MGRVISVVPRFIVAALILLSSTGQSRAETGQWSSPFPQNIPSAISEGDSLTLPDVLYRVGQGNTLLAATEIDRAAAPYLIDQSRRWPNPELEIDVENFSGGLPGLSQSEWSLAIAQELQLWGIRGARGRVAEAEVQSVERAAALTVFDLYAETSLLFRELQHAQTRQGLLKEGYVMSQSLVASARVRVEKGAALTSELYLAELETARNRMDLEEAEAELLNARLLLAGMWNGRLEEISGASGDAALPELPTPGRLASLLEGSPELAGLQLQATKNGSELALARAERLPSLTLRTGIRRLQGEGINTFIVGLAMPLPVFNRNQGSVASLQARTRAIDLETTQTRRRIETEVRAIHERAGALRAKLTTLDRDIIPRARETFQALQAAYDSGKLPYSTLLEGKRLLLDWQHERNDTVLEYHREILSLERLLGLTHDTITARVEDKS